MPRERRESSRRTVKASKNSSLGSAPIRWRERIWSRPRARISGFPHGQPFAGDLLRVRRLARRFERDMHDGHAFVLAFAVAADRHRTELTREIRKPTVSGRIKKLPDTPPCP